MKLLTIFSTLLLFSFIAGSACAQQKNQDIKTTSQENICPPNHQETIKMLEYFFSDKLDGNNLKKRKEWGLDKITMHDISHLDKESDELACQKFKKRFSWEKNKSLVWSYYKTNNYYLIVNAQKEIPTPKGKVNLNTGTNTLTILNKEFKLLETILL